MFFASRLFRGFWVTALALFVVMLFYPISNRFTRGASVALLLAVWFGLVVLCWRWRIVRFFQLAITVFCTGFLLLPARTLPDATALRGDYIAGLRHYENVRYVWGGESLTGIDCSGLIRRGLIDSLFMRGLRTFDPGLIRHAISLWWHDCTANDLGEAYGQLTIPLFDTPSINALDHSRLLPGDLAVTSGGEHIMAYIGTNTWIEADPGAGRVIIVAAPSAKNAWFQMPMKIVRWSIFQQ